MPPGEPGLPRARMLSMSPRSGRHWPRALRSLLALATGAVLAGCHHNLEPEPVVFPPVPEHFCPQLPAEKNQAPAATPPEPQPIDLTTALRLTDAQNPEIALARERVREAMAFEE